MLKLHVFGPAIFPRFCARCSNFTKRWFASFYAAAINTAKGSFIQSFFFKLTNKSVCHVHIRQSNGEESSYSKVTFIENSARQC